MNTPTRIASLLIAGALSAGPALTASAQQSGLVNVDISNVRTNIARDINVNVSQIPVNVQVPIGVAATVCGVNANVLAQQNGGNAACTATSTSQALASSVQRQLVAQSK
jgi:hypothetical protein